LPPASLSGGGAAPGPRPPGPSGGWFDPCWLPPGPRPAKPSGPGTKRPPLAALPPGLPPVPAAIPPAEPPPGCRASPRGAGPESFPPGCSPTFAPGPVLVPPRPAPPVEAPEPPEPPDPPVPPDPPDAPGTPCPPGGTVWAGLLPVDCPPGTGTAPTAPITVLPWPLLGAVAPACDGEVPAGTSVAGALACGLVPLSCEDRRSVTGG